MKYANIRSLIETGDCIAVKRRTGMLANLTRILTNSPHTHTALAIWLEGRLMVSEVNSGGNHLVPLSQYVKRGLAFDVFGRPSELTEFALHRTILDSREEPIDYAFFDLILAGLNALFDLRLNPSGHGLICAADTARTYRMAGVDRIYHPIPTPADVVFGMKFKFSVDV